MAATQPDWWAYCPLKGVGTTSSNITPITFGSGANEKYVRAPSSYVYKLEDVSAADSGRVEDTTMYKNMRGQLVGLELSWQNIGTAEASAILNAFNHEYLWVSYLDLKAGGIRKAEFYVGNRSAPMYNNRLGLWQNLSFNLIKRDGITAPAAIT